MKNEEKNHQNNRNNIHFFLLFYVICFYLKKNPCIEYFNILILNYHIKQKKEFKIIWKLAGIIIFKHEKIYEKDFLP